MARYVVRRVGQALVVLLGVSVVAFALIHLVPGDPVRLALGTRFDPDVYAALRERAGLDRPVVLQYFTWLGGALTGDLGVSFRSGDSVTATLLSRLPRTLLLAGGGLVIALLVSIPLGILSAVKRGSATDRVATVFSQLGISIPNFWLGILFILLFALTLGWLPSQGYVPFTEDPVQALRRLAMPALTVGLVSGSVLTRFMRSAVLESLGQDYTRTAESKGLRRRVVLLRHVVRNAWVPFVTVAGLQLAFLLSGVIVVEIVFAWPGLGDLALTAVQRRDYPLLQGTVLLLAGVFLLINLLVDLLYGYLDPRIRYE